MTGTEAIDVEQLLHRAYREKQVHRLGSAAVGECSRLLAKLIGLSGPSTGGGGWGGEVVDTSCFASRTVARQNAALEALQGASDELLTVHDAVLGLPDFFVEVGVGVDFIVWDEETAARMGHKIDAKPEGSTIVAVRRRGGRRAGADDLLPDGPRRRVVRIVTAPLLVRHGNDVTRPEVAELLVVGQRPIYQGNRKDRVIGHEPVYETAAEIVAVDRATWAVWHAALGILASSLAGLPGYTITGPAAPAAPWAGPAPVVHEGQAQSGLEPAEKADEGDPGVPWLNEWPRQKRPRKPRAKPAAPVVEAASA